MVCEHATGPELSGYADGELAGERERWWADHLANCPSCRDALARLRVLRDSLKRHLPPREPSSAFRDDLRRTLRSERPRAVPALGGRGAWYVGLAATLVFAAGVGVGRAARGGGQAAIADEVVAGHVRSLEVDHLVDVESSEHHVVKPWFAGKLDFSPPVPELSEHGFPLVGGRVDYLGGRPVAALVYARGPHRINLLVWPGGTAAGCAREPTETRQGFHLLHGRAGGMELWAVSDLNRGELEEFVSRWQREVSPDDRSCT
jgi:anti-sigma factor RsiW